MRFGDVPLDTAIGCVLAHSVTTGTGRLRKGTRLEAKHLRQLRQDGQTSVMVARLDEQDVHEDAAAAELAQALAGAGVRVGRAATGRVNLHAEFDGMVDFDRHIIDRINAIDEGITVATILPSSPVVRGRMVATVKIIPYGVTRTSLTQAVQTVTGTLRVHARRRSRAVLIQTRLSGTRESMLDKTAATMRHRLQEHDAQLAREYRSEHELMALARQLDQALLEEPGSDWLLIIGASAIADRRDVIPAAIEHLGGEVLRFGMPVDPGNLLLLGKLRGRTVIGLPGCARSPARNGVDFVLQRLACDLPVDGSWISTLGVGGLLHEIVDRPQPRVSVSSSPRLAALVLAAGSSRRYGARNKLLAAYRGSSILAHVLKALDASVVGETLVVTGHDAQAVTALCDEHDRTASTPVQRIHNQRHAEGMAGSLITGVAELDERGVDAILVCLGDMPDVSAAVINTLVAAWHTHPGKAMYVPAHDGQRGNPVIISSSLFDSILRLEGDVGARVLARQFPDSVLEVACGSAEIFRDIDEPEDLAEDSASD